MVGLDSLLISEPTLRQGPPLLDANAIRFGVLWPYPPSVQRGKGRTGRRIAFSIVLGCRNTTPASIGYTNSWETSISYAPLDERAVKLARK